jgi:hypothetical protein
VIRLRKMAELAELGALAEMLASRATLLGSAG